MPIHTGETSVDHAPLGATIVVPENGPFRHGNNIYALLPVYDGVAVAGVSRHRVIGEGGAAIVRAATVWTPGGAPQAAVLKLAKDKPASPADFAKEGMLTEAVYMAGLVRGIGSLVFVWGYGPRHLVMDRAKGQPLTTYMSERAEAGAGPMPLVDALRMTRTLVDTAGLYDTNVPSVGCIVHHDLTPDNIMYDPETGEVTIVDFGIAVSSLGITPRKATDPHGNPAFMPYEVYSGILLDCRTNYYQIAATLLDTLTRREYSRERRNPRSLGAVDLQAEPPKAERGRVLDPDDFAAIAMETFQDAFSIGGGKVTALIETLIEKYGIPEAVASFIRQGMAGKPENRFQTAQEMAMRLDEIIRGLEAPADHAVRAATQ